MTGTSKNKKIGRPTDSPKQTQIAVRFDDETLEILDKFCAQENISRAEGVRRAAKSLFIRTLKSVDENFLKLRCKDD